MKIRHQQAGFSLIEVLVTAVILATGLLGIAGLQISGMKNSHNALLKTQARYIASSLLNKIRENSVGLSDYLVDNTYTCSTPPTPNCISTSVGTTVCSATELANSEKYQAICGNTVSASTNGGVKNELPNASMTIQCIASDGTFGSDCSTNNVSISISWGERNLTGGGTAQTSIRITGSI